MGRHNQNEWAAPTVCRVQPLRRREIIGYLAASQGLSSSEVQDIAYALEKRRNVVENVPNEDVKNACTRCHSYARIAAERRTREEWLKLKDFHLATFPEELNSPEWPPSADKAINYLAQRFPLHTPEWERERNEPPLGQGSWTIWGHEPGRGDYIGTMSIAPGKDGTYQSRTSLEFAGGDARGAKRRGCVLRRLRLARQHTVERREKDS